MNETTGKFPFGDPALSPEARLDDLLSRLTLDEKIGLIPTYNAAVERLGIAAWSIGAEGAHGFVDREGVNTTFPQTIGLAATWDRGLLGKVGEVAATEARVYYETHGRKGGLALWSPTVDLERDPRWGRTEEGYGEDPFLTGELSSGYIRGAQGDDPFYLRASCGPKHFFTNNNEKDRGSCSCSVPARCMNEYYLVPFKTAVMKAKAVSMMAAYNRVNGIPMMLHPILEAVVKNEWGLEGHLVTDGGGFSQTVNLHHYFENHAETLAAALRNGADSMTDETDLVTAAVKEALEKKLIDEAELDRHVRRILSIRFRLGHFDPPGHCPYDGIGASRLMKDEYARLAREAVGKSVVLLKNDENLLPLRSESTEGCVAVIGPLSNAVHLDWYSGIPAYVRTPLDGMRELFGAERIVHADCRDVVSFSTEDGRPLVLADGDGGRLLCVGNPGQAPARFYMEDWGWGSRTFADVETGLLLESALWRKKPGSRDESEENCIRARGKSSHNWFALTVFSLVPQAGGLVLLRTFDNRCVSVPAASADSASTPDPVFMRDAPECGKGELFRITVELNGMDAAVEAAGKADTVVFVAGNNPMINGRECTDRPSLNLPPWQEECVNRVFAVNPRMALVMISGYPYTCKAVSEKIPAIMWMAPGIQETGRGLADVIGGIRSPAGRLPLTWYEDEKQLPSIMEYDIISAGTTYQYFPGRVLWPFGYGLSYSVFAYSDLSIDKTSAGEEETVAVSFRLENSGDVIAEEVPQLYVTVCGSVFRRPIKTLKGFDRISLAPGEACVVRFDLPVDELAVWDCFAARFRLENCHCQVSVGASSGDIRLSGGFNVFGENLFPRKICGPIYAERFDDYSDCFLHEKRGSGVPAVFGKKDGAWIRFAALDFATGGSGRFSAIVQGNAESRIEARLDSPSGRLLGTVAVPNTGFTCDFDPVGTSPRRLPFWAAADCAVEKICGVHDLYLVMYGETGIWEFDLRKQ